MCVGEGQQVWRREIKREKELRKRRAGSMWVACWERPENTLLLRKDTQGRSGIKVVVVNYKVASWFSASNRLACGSGFAAASKQLTPRIKLTCVQFVFLTLLLIHFSTTSGSALKMRLWKQQYVVAPCDVQQSSSLCARLRLSLNLKHLLYVLDLFIFLVLCVACVFFFCLL